MSEIFEIAKSITGSHAAGVRSGYDLLAKDVTPLVRAVVDGFDYNPGQSDLDNEQPIHVRMTLGDYRRAKRLLHQLERP